MRLSSIIVGSVFAATGFAAQAPASTLMADYNQPNEGKSLAAPSAAQEMLSRLSTEEKISLLTGIGFSVGGSLEGTDNFIPGVAGYTRAMTHHGLPSMLLADGPAGLRFGEPAPGETPERLATAFPIATAVASTWDQGLASSMGAAMGREARAYGIDIILAPGMNLQRDPLGGRNYEYYSEDPVLSGRMAAAAVRGIQSTGVGATIKHFVANNQETNRTALDTIVDEKTLRELYLRGFEIAVKESRPAAIMTAYNLLNGTHTSESAWLNTDILRGEWGFDGIVMTDWFAGTNPAQQILAGHNLLMPGTDRDRESIAKAVESGALSEEALDKALLPTLEGILRTRSFAIQPFNAEAHAQLARQVGADGIVLLKNEDTLPLDLSQPSIALFGVGAFDTVSGGTGSGDVAEAYTVSIAEGLEAGGFQLDPTVAAPVKKHIADFTAGLQPRTSIFDPKPRVKDIPLDPELIQQAALANDSAVITISRLAGEFADRGIEGDFRLSAIERDLIATVSAAFRSQNKKIIVVLNVAGPIEVVSWAQDVDAVMVAWMGGQEAGSALADIVSGVIEPSGRLPQTWPVRYADVSTADDFPGSPTSDRPVPAYAGFAQALPSLVTYNEKSAVGYRAYPTGSKEVAYPFGFGLSYTRFELDDSQIKLKEDQLVVSSKVLNVGDRTGRSVLQVYVEGPQGSTSQPVAELKGFFKTPEIAAGGGVRARLSIALRDLARFDVDAQAWILAPGSYRVSFGFSSQDIRSQHTIFVENEMRYAL